MMLPSAGGIKKHKQDRPQNTITNYTLLEPKTRSILALTFPKGCGPSTVRPSSSGPQLQQKQQLLSYTETHG